MGRPLTAAPKPEPAAFVPPPMYTERPGWGSRARKASLRAEEAERLGHTLRAAAFRQEADLCEDVAAAFASDDRGRVREALAAWSAEVIRRRVLRGEPPEVPPTRRSPASRRRQRERRCEARRARARAREAAE